MPLNKKLVRLIARLDVKGKNLVKTVHMEGLRVMGDPQVFASDYYHQGADELIYMDIVASLYERSISPEIIQRAADNIFIPLTVGGGIRSVTDVKNLLRAGADKVAINTAAVKRPELITEVAREFGSQCMLLSIEAKERSSGKWEVYTDCGREASGLDVLDWAKKGVALGAGEILVTSIDREGTKSGFDYQLVKAICEVVAVPVIASGGYGQKEHLSEVVSAGADAVAFAHVLHYSKVTLTGLRKIADEYSIPVRAIR
jgi:imidazole glycerol-phosphate synthase subunit HisF